MPSRGLLTANVIVFFLFSQHIIMLITGTEVQIIIHVIELLTTENKKNLSCIM